MSTAAPPDRPLDLSASNTLLLKQATRSAVLDQITDGASEDAIFARQINVGIKTARLASRDEFEVEVAACLARRMVAEILAELAEQGIHPEG
jgi:hypothetical protein